MAPSGMVPSSAWARGWIGVAGLFWVIVGWRAGIIQQRCQQLRADRDRYERVAGTLMGDERDSERRDRLRGRSSDDARVESRALHAKHIRPAPLDSSGVGSDVQVAAFSRGISVPGAASALLSKATLGTRIAETRGGGSRERRHSFDDEVPLWGTSGGVRPRGWRWIATIGPSKERRVGIDVGTILWLVEGDRIEGWEVVHFDCSRLILIRDDRVRARSVALRPEPTWCAGASLRTGSSLRTVPAPSAGSDRSQ